MTEKNILSGRFLAKLIAKNGNDYKDSSSDVEDFIAKYGRQIDAAWNDKIAMILHRSKLRISDKNLFEGNFLELLCSLGNHKQLSWLINTYKKDLGPVVYAQEKALRSHAGDNKMILEILDKIKSEFTPAIKKSETANAVNSSLTAPSITVVVNTTSSNIQSITLPTTTSDLLSHEQFMRQHNTLIVQLENTLAEISSIILGLKNKEDASQFTVSLENLKGRLQIAKFLNESYESLQTAEEDIKNDNLRLERGIKDLHSISDEVSRIRSRLCSITEIISPWLGKVEDYAQAIDPIFENNSVIPDKLEKVEDYLTKIVFALPSNLPSYRPLYGEVAHLIDYSDDSNKRDALIAIYLTLRAKFFQVKLKQDKTAMDVYSNDNKSTSVHTLITISSKTVEVRSYFPSSFSTIPKQYKDRLFELITRMNFDSKLGCYLIEQKDDNYTPSFLTQFIYVFNTKRIAISDILLSLEMCFKANLASLNTYVNGIAKIQDLRFSTKNLTRLDSSDMNNAASRRLDAQTVSIHKPRTFEHRESTLADFKALEMPEFDLRFIDEKNNILSDCFVTNKIHKMWKEKASVNPIYLHNLNCLQLEGLHMLDGCKETIHANIYNNWRKALTMATTDKVIKALIQTNVAICELYGFGCDVDKFSASSILEECMTHNEKAKLHHTRLLYENKPERIFHSKDAVLTYQFALAYERGISVTRDLSKAIELYKQAAQMYHSEAIFKVSRLLEYKDKKEEARIYLKKYLGVSPYIDARYYLLSKNITELELMENKDSLLHYYLGLAYLQGRNVKINEDKAFYHFNIAISLGSTGAERFLQRNILRVSENKEKTCELCMCNNATIYSTASHYFALYCKECYANCHEGASDELPLLDEQVTTEEEKVNDEDVEIEIRERIYKIKGIILRAKAYHVRMEEEEKAENYNAYDQAMKARDEQVRGFVEEFKALSLINNTLVQNMKLANRYDYVTMCKKYVELNEILKKLEAV